jgi:hypothetical protein
MRTSIEVLKRGSKNLAFWGSQGKKEATIAWSTKSVD